MPDEYGQISPDELLKLATQAGLYPQLAQQMQQRMGMGAELMNAPTAQGRNVGQTYVASSPLEHVSNAIRRIIGAKMAGDAMHGQRDLTNQLGQQRQQFVQGLGTAMNGGSGGTLGQEGGGMARPADPAQANQLLMGAFASGDPGLEKMAGGMMQERNQERQMRVLENTLRHQQVMEEQGQGRLDQGNKRLDEAEKALAQRGVRYNPNTGQFENISGKVAHPPKAGAATVLPVSTGQTGSEAVATPAGPHAQPLGGKMLDKALKELGADFDPNGGRAGEFGKQQQRINAATRALTLAEGPDGKPVDLNPQQMAEFTQSIASLIGGGGVAAQGQIEHLLPKSFTRDAAGIMQYLTSEPHGAGQQAFVQNMIDTAKRERDVAQKGIEQVRTQRSGKHQRVLNGNPIESKRLLNGFGWDLGPDGMPVMKGAAAPQQTGTDSLRAKYGL